VEGAGCRRAAAVRPAVALDDRTTPVAWPTELAASLAPSGRRRLLQQLIAFSEGQSLRPEALVVLPLLCDLADRLRHALDARIDVRVNVRPDCPTCFGDRLALEVALMNLVVNARDAMPRHGYLLLRAGACWLPSALPGVEIAVSNPGAGMDAASLSRAGVPVFTTRAGVPRASMGLAATNGFARQSGGSLALASGRYGGFTAGLRLPQGRPTG
jgi:signal transduction histidine kinase